MSDFIRYRPDSATACSNRPARALRCDSLPVHTVATQMVVEGFVEMSREQYDLDGGKADSTFSFEVDHDGKTYRFDGVRPEIEADRVTFRFRGPA
ncbi:hypothetical protein ABMY26_07075 (plasmid) [Azospirillum sp. HJ39]|uniref:hypothetical protein n=1 Tax=Azospirillum sp. HJ39 TaxID=3159496 RepID=UPI0035562DC3